MEEFNDNLDQLGQLWVIRVKGLPKVLGYSYNSVMSKTHSSYALRGKNVFRHALSESRFTKITDLDRLAIFDPDTLPEVIPYRPLRRLEIEAYLEKHSYPEYRKKDLYFYTRQELRFEQAAILLSQLQYLPKCEWNSILQNSNNTIISSMFGLNDRKKVKKKVI